MASFYENPFAAMMKIPMEEVLSSRDLLGKHFISAKHDASLGSACETNGRRRFLFGPDYYERLNQWMEFILSTRGKNDGYFFCYGKTTDFNPKPWANNTLNITIKPSLDDMSARRIIRKIKETPESNAIIFSGSLLSDLLMWMRRNEVIGFQRDVVFTTMDRFPKSMMGDLKKYFGDWCDFMRQWNGGLTFFRCQHGTYHTTDHITVIKAKDNGECIVSDFINESEYFLDYPTGDKITRSQLPSMCQCGLWHFNFKYLGWDGNDLLDKNNKRISLNLYGENYPAGYQILQESKGSVIALSPYEWSDESMDSVRMITDQAGIEVKFGKGYFRKGNSKPACASTLITPKNLFFIHIESVQTSKQFIQLSV